MFPLVKPTVKEVGVAGFLLVSAVDLPFLLYLSAPGSDPFHSWVNRGLGLGQSHMQSSSGMGPLRSRCVESPLSLAGSLYLWFLDSSPQLDFLDFNSSLPVEFPSREDSFPMPPSRLLAMDPMDLWKKHRCLCHVVDGVKPTSQ